MKLRTGSMIVSVTVFATACATTETAPKKTAAAAPSLVTLISTNGDMKRYLGTWTSNCGREYQVTPDGRGALKSGINAFSFTSAAGNTAQGTLTVDSFESPDCSGPNKRTSAKIAMTYLGNIPVGSSFGEGMQFSGSADKVTANVTGTAGMDGSNAFNIGFLEGFGGFRLAPLESFSSTNLVYTKKP